MLNSETNPNGSMSRTTLPSPTTALGLTLTGVDDAYVIISNFMAIASMASCLLIVSIYVAYKDVRTTSRLLLVLLSCADFIVNVATLLQTATYYKSFTFPSQKSFLCQTAAGVMVYSQVCAALWTTALTFYLFLSISGRCIKVARSVFIFFNVFCWLMPMVVSLSADIAGVYGYNMTDIVLYKHPSSCWIGNKVKNPLSWFFLTVEGWVIAAYIIVSILYLVISWTICCKKTKGKQISGDDIGWAIEEQRANEQLRFIPVIYVCTRIWGTGYFLFTQYPHSRHPRASDWLMIIKAFGDNSQGLVNVIFFCLATKQVRHTLATALYRYCSCFSGWYSRHKFIGTEKWMRVQQIVRRTARLPRRSRNLDGSDLDLSGISLDLPAPDAEFAEDEVIFEQ
jgi:hypothetical protein